MIQHLLANRPACQKESETRFWPRKKKQITKKGAKREKNKK
jgi:hypothetical protein